MERDKRRKRLKVLRRIRNIGMAMTGIGGGISGAPGLLPPLLGQAALYLIVVGTVITVGSQAVINDITDDGEGDGFGGFGGMDGFGGYGGYVGADGGLCGLWGRWGHWGLWGDLGDFGDAGDFWGHWEHWGLLGTLGTLGTFGDTGDTGDFWDSGDLGDNGPWRGMASVWLRWEFSINHLKIRVMDNYRMSIYGGAIFGMLPNLPVENLLATMLMAVVGTLTSFLVTVLLKYLGGFEREDRR